VFDQVHNATPTGSSLRPALHHGGFEPLTTGGEDFARTEVFRRWAEREGLPVEEIWSPQATARNRGFLESER
jgi:hypothetical protein